MPYDSTQGWYAPKNRIPAASTSTRKPEIDLDNCPPVLKVTNRAEKGGMKKKPIYLTWSGRAYPQGADPKRPDTLLQPGDSASVPSEVIFGNFGNPFLPIARENKDMVASRFGGYKYDTIPRGKLIYRSEIPTAPIGPPDAFPDILVEVMDARGQTVGDVVSVYDTFIEGSIFLDPIKR